MTDRKDKVLKELYDIAICPDILKRIDLIEDWVDSKIESISTSQIIIDRKYLTSDHEDELKYAMATKIAESLLDKCGAVTIDGNRVTIEITGIVK